MVQFEASNIAVTSAGGGGQRRLTCHSAALQFPGHVVTSQMDALRRFVYSYTSYAIVVPLCRQPHHEEMQPSMGGLT